MIAKTTPESAQRQSLTALLAGVGDLPGVPEVEVSGLQLDSRKVVHGDLFVALHGHQSHGLEHAEQAISQGAAAIIYDPKGAKSLEDKIGT